MTLRQMNALRVGDVVLRHDKDGRVTTRVIRYVSERLRRGDPRGFVGCVKQRKSQYPYPFTLLYPVELLQRSYQPTGKRLRLRSRMDERLARQLEMNGSHRREDLLVTQDEVVGVIS